MSARLLYSGPAVVVQEDLDVSHVDLKGRGLDHAKWTGNGRGGRRREGKSFSEFFFDPFEEKLGLPASLSVTLWGEEKGF